MILGIFQIYDHKWTEPARKLSDSRWWASGTFRGNSLSGDDQRKQIFLPWSRSIFNAIRQISKVFFFFFWIALILSWSPKEIIGGLDKLKRKIVHKICERFNIVREVSQNINILIVSLVLQKVCKHQTGNWHRRHNPDKVRANHYSPILFDWADAPSRIRKRKDARTNAIQKNNLQAQHPQFIRFLLIFVS